MLIFLLALLNADPNPSTSSSASPLTCKVTAAVRVDRKGHTLRQTTIKPPFETVYRLTDTGLYIKGALQNGGREYLYGKWEDNDGATFRVAQIVIALDNDRTAGTVSVASELGTSVEAVRCLK